MIVDKTLYVKHGTDCWGYAMCAGGTIDLVIEKDLEIWDIVAARAIIEAAGGIVTAWNKSEAASDRSVIAAANIETYNFFTEIFNDRLMNLGFKIITPKNKDDRGSHISIVHEESWRITKCLTDPEYHGEKKIIVDFRPPNIIRIALTPLYISFNDIYIICIRLINIIESKEYESKDESKSIVT